MTNSTTLLALADYQRADLLNTMRDISESYYCAGWLIGLEHSLWGIVFEGVSPRFGMGEITADEIAKLRALAEVTGIWWHWPRDADSEQPIALDEFAALRALASQVQP